MRSQNPIKVAIVHKLLLLRNAFQTGLSAEKTVLFVGGFDSYEKLMSQTTNITVDVILLGVNTVDANFLNHNIHMIKVYLPGVKIIMMLEEEDESIISKILGAGANSYVLKSDGTREMCDVIEKVHEEEFYLKTSDSKALLHDLQKKSKITEEVLLTEREKTLLKLTCEDKRTKEIAEIMKLSPRTVEAIRQQLNSKTSTKGIAGLVMFATTKAKIVEV